MSRLGRLITIFGLAGLCSSLWSEQSTMMFWMTQPPNPPPVEVLSPGFFKNTQKPLPRFSQGVTGPRYWDDEPITFSRVQRKEWIKLCQKLHPKNLNAFKSCFQSQKEQTELARARSGRKSLQ